MGLWLPRAGEEAQAARRAARGRQPRQEEVASAEVAELEAFWDAFPQLPRAFLGPQTAIVRECLLATHFRSRQVICSYEASSNHVGGSGVVEVTPVASVMSSGSGSPKCQKCCNIMLYYNSDLWYVYEPL